jgi:hypothetical protein
MRRRRVLVFVAGAAALLGTGCAQAAPTTTTPMPSTTPVSTPAAVVRAAGLWGRAIAVPGLVALNKGRNAGVSSVSCATPGSCAAGGFYADGGRHQQGFVVSEKNGRWGQAVEVPGLGALNKGRSADVVFVSCASAGDCAAVGYYGNNGSNPYVVTSGRGFVISEQNGRWGRAVEVPGLAALNKGGSAEVGSVSCASPGNCAAVGFYRDGGRHQQGFVASEKNGVWLQAIEVPGLGALNKGGNAGASSVSCASAGNCAAGGDYADASGGSQGFVVSEKNGVWGIAQKVAGNLNPGETSYPRINSVSCASPGNCAAGGQYSGPGGQQAFVVSEVNGAWAAAQEVAGSLNIGGFGWVASVSCASAGNCSAGGAYDYGGYNAPFVVNEKNGIWAQAIDVPGLVTRDAWISSVSCATAGNCGAGGGYDGAGNGAFVVSEKNGVWDKGIKVPGPGGLSADVGPVSCASAGSCVAGGAYTDASGHSQGFVT